MARLNVELDDEQLEDLRRYAARRRTPVSWLIKDYVQYLLAGGQPFIPDVDETMQSRALAEIVQHGGAFNWLADEPDLYSADDGAHRDGTSDSGSSGRVHFCCHQIGQ